MKKVLLLLLSVLIFSGCSALVYSHKYNSDEIKFKITEEEFITKKLVNTKYISTFDSCANLSYLLVSPTVFLEHISLSASCSWNGLASGYFESQFKQKLKLKTLTALERVDIGNYTFSTLKVNDSHRLQTISIWGSSVDTLIIDFEGTLSKELLSKLDPNYKNKFTSLPLFKTKYKESLVKNNFFQKYFEKEDTERIILD